MNEKIVVKCRICGRLMSRYPYMVYPGDESCCSQCNKEAENDSYTSDKYSRKEGQMIHELLTLWDEYKDYANGRVGWDVENDCLEKPDHSLEGFMEYL